MPKENVTTVRHGNLTWTDIVHPDMELLKKIGKKYKFHPLDLEDCLSEVELQRPKIDDYDDYLFIVLHFPKYNKRSKRVEQSELNIFVGQNYVITVHREHKPLSDLFDEAKKKKKIREEYMSKGSGFLLYSIVDDMIDECFPMSEKLLLNVNAMEKEVFDFENTRDRLKEILGTKKDIINFRRIIMPQRVAIAQLEHKNKKFLPEDLDVYFEDIVDKVERLYSSLENLSELIDSLQNTNESIISHNTNNVIRVLTIFSVILMPLTLLTGFYGMNVKLPLDQYPQAVSIIAITMALIALTMIAFFKYKKWL